MKRIVRLTESDLTRLVKRVIRESEEKNFNPNDVLGAVKLEYIQSATFAPNDKDDRNHLTKFKIGLKDENWNFNNGIIIFKYDDEVYIAPHCTNDIAQDYLEKKFGYRNERIGVPSYLAQSDSWYAKNAFREFTEVCR